MPRQARLDSPGTKRRPAWRDGAGESRDRTEIGRGLRTYIGRGGATGWHFDVWSVEVVEPEFVNLSITSHERPPIRRIFFASSTPYFCRYRSF